MNYYKQIRESRKANGKIYVHCYATGYVRTLDLSGGMYQIIAHAFVASLIFTSLSLPSRSLKYPNIVLWAAQIRNAAIIISPNTINNV